MPKINIDGFQTYYEMHGSGNETLVLINGLKADHTGWTPVIENLSKKYKVLIFDNRGAGQADSPDEDYTVNQMASDAIGLIRKLEIINPIVIGHSLGGAIAQTMALKYGSEMKALELCNTFPKFNDHPCQIFNKAIELHKQLKKPSEILKSFIHEVFSDEFLSPDGLVETILKLTDEAPFPQTYEGYKGQMAALTQFDSRSWLEEINLPTLIIHAESDRVVSTENAKELSSKITNSSLEVIPGGHASQVEQPELFCMKINNFIQSIQQ